MPVQSYRSPCPKWEAYRGPDGAWRPPRSEGLARVVAKAGYGARPRVEAMIQAGRLTVSGQVVRDPGCAVGPESIIHLDGEVLREAPRHYLAVNKPFGIDCLHLRDSSYRSGELLPVDMVGVEPAGRLDVRTAGLLLMSNDNWWNTQLSRDGNLVRRFEALLAGQLTQAELDLIRAGVFIPQHGTCKPLAIEIVPRSARDTLLRLDVHGGQARQIRTLFGTLRHQVLRLVRLGIGPVSLQGLGSGKHRLLTLTEVQLLVDPVHLAGQVSSSGARSR